MLQVRKNRVYFLLNSKRIKYIKISSNTLNELGIEKSSDSTLIMLYFFDIKIKWRK